MLFLLLPPLSMMIGSKRSRTRRALRYLLSIVAKVQQLGSECFLQLQAADALFKTQTVDNGDSLSHKWVVILFYAGSFDQSSPFALE